MGSLGVQLNIEVVWLLNSYLVLEIFGILIFESTLNEHLFQVSLEFVLVHYLAKDSFKGLSFDLFHQFSAYHDVI